MAASSWDSGVEDEPDWPHKPSNLSTRDVYVELEHSLRIVAGICRPIETAILLTAPKSDCYGFSTMWDLAFDHVRNVCKHFELKLVECTQMVDALDLGDRYHMKKTTQNIEIASSFITNLLGIHQ